LRTTATAVGHIFQTDFSDIQFETPSNVMIYYAACAKWGPILFDPLQKFCELIMRRLDFVCNANY